MIAKASQLVSPFTLLVSLAVALPAGRVATDAQGVQLRSSSLSFFRQSDRRALILFVDVRSELPRPDDEGWRSTARAVPDNKLLQPYDVAAQTLILNDQVLEMDKMVGDMLRDWEAPDHRSLLTYDSIWIVGGPIGGVLARELAIRQPLVASKLRVIAWYGPVEATERKLGVAALLMNAPGKNQTTDLQVPLDAFIDRQTARWLPLAGEKGIDVHCATPKPVASHELGRYECRSMSIVKDPTSPTSPGGTADMERWLSRLTRLPSKMQQAKPLAVYSQKLRATEPLRVSCNATSYAAPKIVLPDDVKGRIRSAYGLLEDANNISRGSVKVRSFTDREVFVIAELSGLNIPDGRPCVDGEARAVVLVTIEGDGGK